MASEFLSSYEILRIFLRSHGFTALPWGPLQGPAKGGGQLGGGEASAEGCAPTADGLLRTES